MTIQELTNPNFRLKKSARYAIIIGCVGVPLLLFAACFLSSSLESKVRQWSKEYPSDLRNRWAWCYLDSAENWSTDQKLREDVRLKSAQVLTADERETLTPLNQKINDAVRDQEKVSINRPKLKEMYFDIGNGLKTAEWHPPPTEPPPPPPKPEPPQRRRLFRGTQSP